MEIAKYNDMMAYLTRKDPGPRAKPQELLDLQEKNRQQRIKENLDTIGPSMEPESKEFIEREEFKAGGVFGNTAEKREKTLKDIKKYFDKQIQKGPVSMSDMEKKFPKQARVTITKALGEEADKLTRVTPLQTKFKNKVSKIINDVYDNKKPLINASPRRIFKELYGREFNINKDNSSVIKKIIQSDPDLRQKYGELSPKITNTSTRVGAGNKLFETVKVKDFDKALSESIKKRGVTRAGTVEEFILRDLKRHIDQGGKKFKFAKNNTFDKGFKGLKIKDLKKGDIIDFKAIQKDDPRFREYKKVFDDIKKLKLTPYVDPITKEETTLMQGLQKATNVEAPLHIQHNKGVANDPLKNLSIQTFKANIGAKMVETPEQAKKLGVQTTVPGSKKVVGPKLSFEDQVDRLTKFSDRMIKGAGTRELKTPTQTLFDKPTAMQELMKRTGAGVDPMLLAKAGYEEFLKPAGKYGKYALQIAGTPLGATGIVAGTGVDPRSTIDRLGVEAEAALAPALVRGTQEFTKNQLAQRILNLGLSPKVAMRAARIASPIGIASLLGEAGYGLYKAGQEQKERIARMSPEEREQFFAEEEGRGLMGEVDIEETN